MNALAEIFYIASGTGDAMLNIAVPTVKDYSRVVTHPCYNNEDHVIVCALPLDNGVHI